MSTVGCTSAGGFALPATPPLHWQPFLWSQLKRIRNCYWKRLCFQALKHVFQKECFPFNVDVVWQYHAFWRRPMSLVPLQILHAACVFQSICVATVTPCAQWCINVWMLFCNWSNQIHVLYRSLSDADCHLYSLLLLVLVDIVCVSKLFKLYFLKLWHFCLELFCKCFIFSMRQDYLGLVSLCISDSGLHF